MIGLTGFIIRVTASKMYEQHDCDYLDYVLVVLAHVKLKDARKDSRKLSSGRQVTRHGVLKPKKATASSSTGQRYNSDKAPSSKGHKVSNASSR